MQGIRWSTVFVFTLCISNFSVCGNIWHFQVANLCAFTGKVDCKRWNKSFPNSFCLCLFVWLFGRLVVCLIVCLFLCFFVCLFVCLIVWLFHCLFVCLFVCLFDCLIALFVWLLCLFDCFFVSLYLQSFVCFFNCLFVCFFVCLLQKALVEAYHDRVRDEVGPMLSDCDNQQARMMVLDRERQDKQVWTGAAVKKTQSRTDNRSIENHCFRLCHGFTDRRTRLWDKTWTSFIAALNKQGGQQVWTSWQALAPAKKSAVSCT